MRRLFHYKRHVLTGDITVSFPEGAFVWFYNFGSKRREMLLKQKLYQQCQLLVAEKISLQEQALKELQAAAAEETKSTAGDKYETARAMLHIEQDNVRRQLAALNLQRATLDRINPDELSGSVTLGSLVKTNRGHYYLSIALGQIIVDAVTVIALSQKSPLGSKLMQLKVGDRTEQNGIDILVEEVV